MLHDFGDGNGPVPASQHNNGLGWVSDNSYVHPKVFVNRDSEVCQRSRIDLGSNLHGSVKVWGSEISGDSYLSQCSISASTLESVNIEDGAYVERCKISSYKKQTPSIYGNVSVIDTTICGKVRIGRGSKIIRSKLSGDIVVRDGVLTDSKLRGRVVVAESTLLRVEISGTKEGITLSETTCEGTSICGQGRHLKSLFGERSWLRGFIYTIQAKVYGGASLKGYLELHDTYVYDEAMVEGSEEENPLTVLSSEIFASQMLGYGTVQDVYQYSGVMEIRNDT